MQTGSRGVGGEDETEQAALLVQKRLKQVVILTQLIDTRLGNVVPDPQGQRGGD